METLIGMWMMIPFVDLSQEEKPSEPSFSLHKNPLHKVRLVSQPSDIIHPSLHGHLQVNASPWIGEQALLSNGKPTEKPRRPINIMTCICSVSDNEYTKKIRTLIGKVQERSTFGYLLFRVM